MHISRVLSGILLLTSAGPAIAKKTAPTTTTTTAPSTTSSKPRSTCSLRPTDAAVLEYGYAIESLVIQFYNVPLNESFFASAPNNSMALFYQNIKGIEHRNTLGRYGLERLGANITSFRAPRCNYTVPTANSSQDFLMTAFKMEAAACGAFIGIAGYSQSPEVSFLMARLAAEHGIHAIYLQSFMQQPLFSPNAASLVPAYPPAHVLSKGTGMGQLGDYMHQCVTAPKGPCGKTLVVGNITGNLTSTAPRSP